MTSYININKTIFSNFFTDKFHSRLFSMSQLFFFFFFNKKQQIKTNRLLDFRLNFWLTFCVVWNFAKSWCGSCSCRLEIHLEIKKNHNLDKGSFHPKNIFGANQSSKHILFQKLNNNVKWVRIFYGKKSSMAFSQFPILLHFEMCQNEKKKNVVDKLK